VTREELHKLMGHDELSKAAILVFANKQVSDLKIQLETYFSTSSLN
jgi:hypothetical protein